jgi:hypothetical protein
MTQRQENLLGSALTGAGPTNRTYELAHTGIIAETLIVIVDNSIWQKTVNYTLTGSTVTFLSSVWDDSNVTLYYTTTTVGGSLSSYYCEPSDVKRVLRAKNNFSSSTNPSEDEVYEYIQEAMEEIDRLTRNAWRTRTITKEYHSVPDRFFYEYGVGLKLKLGHRNIKPFDSDAGDMIEIWNGTAWEDWVATKSEGRNKDYWLDEQNGFLHIIRRLWFHRNRSIRITYRYGETTVPDDIKKATSLLVAANILESDDYSTSAMINDTSQNTNTSHRDRVENWEQKAYRLLDRRKEFFSF